MPTTITAQQAEERVQDYARQVLATLPADVHATLNFQDTYDSDDPTDGQPTGRVIASVEYQLTGLPPEHYPHQFDQLQQWWSQRGFDILADARPDGYYLWVEHRAEGFRMALQTNDRHELFLMCSSPRVWPTGDPT